MMTETRCSGFVDASPDVLCNLLDRAEKNKSDNKTTSSSFNNAAPCKVSVVVVVV